MKRKKNRIISLLLCCMMMLGLMPMTALAVDLGETSVTVTKVWDMTNAPEGTTHPDSVQVQLYADGEPVENDGRATLISDATTPAPSYTWENLPEKDGQTGEIITYTVREINVPDNYESSVDVNANGGFVITNTYTPEEPITIHIPIYKGVKQEGSTAPGKETFTFELSDFEYSAGAVEYKVINNTVQTDGAGCFDGELVIEVPNGEALYNLGQGFKVTEKNDGKENWKYDQTEWYVTAYIGQLGELVCNYYNLTAGDKVYETQTSYNGLSFANTYEVAKVSNVPRTGDHNAMLLWLALACVCGMTGMITFSYKKRNGR